MTFEEQIKIINKQVEIALNHLNRPDRLFDVQLILLNIVFVLNKKINLGDDVKTIHKNFMNYIKNYIDKIDMDIKRNI